MSLSYDCIKTLIGCFLIQILSGTSIIYASPGHRHILLYITMTQLQSIMTVVHEYGICETSPIIKIKNKILSLHLTLLSQ